MNAWFIESGSISHQPFLLTEEYWHTYGVDELVLMLNSLIDLFCSNNGLKKHNHAGRKKTFVATKPYRLKADNRGYFLLPEAGYYSFKTKIMKKIKILGTKLSGGTKTWAADFVMTEAEKRWLLPSLLWMGGACGAGHLIGTVQPCLIPTNGGVR